MTPAAAGPAVQLRPAALGDLALIMSSWIGEYREGPIGRLMTDTRYYAEVRPIVERLVTRLPPLVACDPGNPDTIYGWACGERVTSDLVVHFLYVRGPWRRWGIARKLLAALGYQAGERVIVTHPTRYSLLFSRGEGSHKRPSIRVSHNPWLGIRRAAGVT